MPIGVELVEQSILTMSKPLQRACKHKYIGLEPDLVAARKLRVPLDTYQNRVTQAVKYVADCLKIGSK